MNSVKCQPLLVKILTYVKIEYRLEFWEYRLEFWLSLYWNKAVK